jgi:hypothetical protein
MKTVLWIVVGLVIAIGAWVPLNLAGRGDIPFGAAILGVVGTAIGSVIVLVAVVQRVRHGSGRPTQRTTEERCDSVSELNMSANFSPDGHPGISGDTQAKRIECEDGSCALEILNDRDGHARFAFHHRYPDGRGHYRWATIHTSGLYADAESAEADAWLQSKDLRKKWLGGMTMNERLFFAGLMDDWDDAVRARDRERISSILSAVETGYQADHIIETVLRRAS